MAAPSYTTDLNDVTTADSSTNWTELSGHTSGGAATAETDYFIQGTGCVSQSLGTKSGTVYGLQFDYGSDLSSSLATGDCFFFWQVLLAGNAIANWASGSTGWGMQVGVGSSSGNINFWKSQGANVNRNPYGGWQNIAIDPTYTVDNAEGSPTSAYQIFASFPNMAQAVQKGNMHGVDAIRYGRGELIVTGGDIANGYATFLGLGQENDYNDATNGYHRWGLFQGVAGGYLWKGLITLGTTGTAVDFRDANRNIVIENCPRTYASFNRIEINNGNSRVDWSNINITAPPASEVYPGEGSILAKGELEVVDNADVNFDGCSFTDMSTFVFRAQSSVLGCTFRRCSTVTGDSTDFSGSIFEETTAASALDWSTSAPTDGKLDGCEFISDGSSHAIEFSSVQPSSLTIRDCIFTGYATSDGSTGNEVIFFNQSSGTYTINTINCTGVVSVRTAGATVTVVSDPVTVKVRALDVAGDPVVGARVFLAASETVASGLPYLQSVSISNSGTTATVTHTGHGLTTNDKIVVYGANTNANLGTHQITVVNANTYTFTTSTSESGSDTGSPVVSFVFAEGVTDANGEVSTLRSFPAIQGATGRVRKSSAADNPKYKNSVLNGDIQTSSDTLFTALMIED